MTYRYGPFGVANASKMLHVDFFVFKAGSDGDAIRARRRKILIKILHEK